MTSSTMIALPLTQESNSLPLDEIGYDGKEEFYNVIGSDLTHFLRINF